MAKVRIVSAIEWEKSEPEVAPPSVETVFAWGSATDGAYERYPWDRKQYTYQRSLRLQLPPQRVFSDEQAQVLGALWKSPRRLASGVSEVCIAAFRVWKDAFDLKPRAILI